MLNKGLPRQLTQIDSLQGAYEALRGYPMIGGFLAYQYAIDLNYSAVLNFTEDEFVMPGPGARSGIRKCFSTIGSYSEADVIRWMKDNQEEEFAKRDLPFKSLWGRDLQLIDCQNLFCEVDKYARIYHPEVKGISDRIKIKQEYRPASKPIDYWFPPKWGINEVVKQWQENLRVHGTKDLRQKDETTFVVGAYRL
jgi:hypothetical protein